MRVVINEKPSWTSRFRLRAGGVDREIDLRDSWSDGMNTGRRWWKECGPSGTGRELLEATLLLVENDFAFQNLWLKKLGVAWMQEFCGVVLPRVATPPNFESLHYTRK